MTRDGNAYTLERHLQTFLLTVMCGLVGYMYVQINELSDRVSVLSERTVSLQSTREIDRIDKHLNEIEARLRSVEHKLPESPNVHR